MKIYYQLLVLAFLIIAAPVHAQQYNVCLKQGVFQNDGGCWNSLAKLDKANVIRGIWVGSAARNLAIDLIDKNISYRAFKDWMATPNQTNNIDLVDYFDALYKTPANRVILWDWAFVLAAMNARDDDSDDRLSLLRLIREDGTMPTFGKLVDAKSADTVVIDIGSKKYDVHLAGVSAAGLTPEQSNRAIAFIRGLRRSDVWKCDNSSATIVSIVYRDNMFNGPNRLSAEIHVKGGVICAGNSRVTSDDLVMFSGDTLIINDALVRLGLINRDSFIDPKWPEVVRKARSEMFWADRAKEQKLYIYGDKKLDVVEKIIKAGQQK